MMPTPVLILPGWQNSGPLHWQSQWEVAHGYRRVEQHDWMRPLRGDWIARLEDVLLSGDTDVPVVLVAHSLGCQLVAAWASHSKNTHLVKACLWVNAGNQGHLNAASELSGWEEGHAQLEKLKELKPNPVCAPSLNSF
jgi:predicted alpha/beta hydrolase family esterase